MSLFCDKKVLVVGAGLSGIAAIKILKTSNAKITLFDGNNKLEEASLRNQLGDINNLRICLGEDNNPYKEDFDFVILSPGVPCDLPYLIELKNRGVKILGEIELAYLHASGRLIAITGTNGKTTTTALVGELMKAYFEDVFVVGNIGIPYTNVALETKENSITVAEMSSFQLETIDTFYPHISAILNLTPDHLNRHYTMENYLSVKCNIFKNQTKNDYLILNYDDNYLNKLEVNNTNVFYFSSTKKVPRGIYVKNDEFVYNNGVEEIVVMKTNELKIIGKHNHENAAVGILVGILMNIPYEVIKKALMEFKAVAHRIEFVKEVNGVKYYNDSKGTNPDASIKAVQAMNSKTVLIGGGYDKGSDYTDWINSFDGKIKSLLLMGQTADKIEETARKLGFNDILRVNSMEEAVEAASKIATEGENVLLSPCCASWGMFKNYEERGDIFKELVNKL